MKMFSSLKTMKKDNVLNYKKQIDFKKNIQIKQIINDLYRFVEIVKNGLKFIFKISGTNNYEKLEKTN